MLAGMNFTAEFRFCVLTPLYFLIALIAGYGAPFRVGSCYAQIIGNPPPANATEASDKAVNFVSRLGERLTSQDLNTKKITCQEEVSVERSGEKGQQSPVRTQRFTMTGEMKQHGSFSIDVSFVEEHVPIESGNPTSPKSEAGQSIDASFLVRDSFSAAPEFLGLNHREIYAQRFLGQETLDGREAFVVAFQTVKQLESRKITLDNHELPMRIAGKAWIDTVSGMLLRLAVQQTKLPKGYREFFYDISYTPPARSSDPILPAVVHFKRVRSGENLATTQTFSNCRVN